MPTFKFIKSMNNNKLPTKSLSYSDWLETHLEIKLEKGTTILNVNYKDNNKDNILPALQNISKSYQNYSGKKRRREIKLGIDFLEDQISIFKTKSNNSLSKVQAYALENDIDFDLNSISQSLAISLKEQGILNNTNSRQITVEKTRVQAANEIRKIDAKIKQLSDIDMINRSPSFFTAFSKQFANDPLIRNIVRNIALIESRLAFKRSIYQENDSEVLDLLKEKESNNQLLKNSLYDFLIAKRREAKAIYDASVRADGVILKYQQLKLEALRDQSALSSLENEYRFMSLEKYRIKDPWELITKPTLLEEPIAPRKGNLLLLSLFLGIITAGVTSVLYDKSKNIIYSEEEIEELTSFPIIGDFRETKDFEQFLDTIDKK